MNITPSEPITGPNGKFPQLASIFEEFEYLGWYFYHSSNDYIFIERPWNAPNYSNQFWSHGGITNSCEDEIKKILN